MWHVTPRELKMIYYSEGGDVKYGSEGAAGIDLPYYDHKRHQGSENIKNRVKRWWIEHKIILPFVRYKLPTGVYVDFHEEEWGMVDSRSSTSKKKMIPLCRTIDPDYRGNIHVVFMMLSLIPRIIKKGECRFQLVIMSYNRKLEFNRVDTKEDLTLTKRGDNGFGHTDKMGEV